MKRCPDCDALYETHVTTCLVDGSPLDELDDDTQFRTGMATAEVTREVARRQVEEAQAQTQATKKRSLVALLLMGAVMLVMVLGVVGFAATAMNTATPAPPPPVPVPVPVPVTATPPTPPAPPPVATFTLRTLPDGAEVHENGVPLCTTPCEVEHPSFAPLPRMFKVTREGYQDEQYEMNDPSTNHQIRLSEVAVAPPPVQAPRPVAAPATPGSRPNPAPRAARPATPEPPPEPAVDLGRKRGDLKNPFK